FTNESSGSTFPLLLIAIVGILTSAFLLVSYYTIVSKYCGTFSSPRGRPRPGPGPDVREAWRFCPSNGLDEAVIGNITVCRSERGDVWSRAPIARCARASSGRTRASGCSPSAAMPSTFHASMLG
ncbi:unnamed protein product, partial [Musa acuminata var. zebrina]